MRGLIRREMPPEMVEAMKAAGARPTLATTKDGMLFWAAEFVDAISNEDLAMGLMHETMHVMLETFKRAAALGVVPEATPEMGAKSYLVNIASDACINAELRKIRPMIKDAIFPETLNQPEGLIFEERYRLLLQEMQKQQAGGEGEGEGEGKGNGSAKGKGNGKGEVVKGWCGGCAGHPVPGEPIAGKSPDGRSEAEMTRLRKETAGAIKEHAQSKGRGTVPDNLVRWADEQFAPPKIDWRQKLAQTVRAAVAYKAGAVDLCWNRMSRRQAGVGFGPGRPIMPAYRAPVPAVSILLDTSGSMEGEDLTAAMSEIQGVLNAVGASVTFAVCDAYVHGVATVATAKAAMEMLKGGGGTDMRPGFEALAAHKTRPDVVICLTDGHIGDGYPAIEPPWRTVWVVIGKGGNPKPCPWGEVVCVDDEAERQAA